MSRSPKDLCVPLGASIRDAMAQIDRNSCGIVMVTDADGRLMRTITDGDIRRAVLAGADLDCCVSTLITRKDGSNPQPICATEGTDPETLLQLMTTHGVRQIPMLTPDGAVCDLVLLDDLVGADNLGVQAVIMAGGFGKRLRPLTDETPKPMLTVGDRPLIEWTIGQLRQSGIRNVNVTTHFRPEKIVDHFGDGSAFGVQIKYVNEERPLGTGGALGLMPRPKDRILVINGDILTKVDFRAMLAYHCEQRAKMTVALQVREYEIAYGVVDMDGPRITGLREKPRLPFYINAGIYLLEPSVYEYLPSGAPFNMTDIVNWLIEAGETVAGFPVREYWLDIGQHQDYARAQTDAANMQAMSLIRQ